MCTICDKVFTARTKLHEHLAIEHQLDCSASDIFVCVICKKKHLSSQELNEHLHQGY